MYLIRLYRQKLLRLFLMNEKNPILVLYAAKMRKGALNDAAKKAGCNKIAYAHHKDDVIETMLLSLLFEGRFHTFSPENPS